MAGARDGLPIADLARVSGRRAPHQAATAALAELGGWLLASGDAGLVQELLGAGAVERRHAHLMSAALEAAGRPAAAPGRDEPTMDVAPLPPVPALYPSWRRAYPAGHPDFEPGADEEVIARCWSHVDTPDYRGAMHRSSAAVLAEGRVVAGMIVTVRPEPAPFGGPWISDIWVDPQDAGRGIGTHLIRRAMHQLHEDGFATLGLAVTHGNPARRVYEQTGFTESLESWTVLLPS